MHFLWFTITENLNTLYSIADVGLELPQDKFLMVHQEVCSIMLHLHAVLHLQQCLKFDLTKRKEKRDDEPKANNPTAEGIENIGTWGHDAMLLCEAFLRRILHDTDSTVLSTAPDHIFAMITLAAATLMKGQATVFHHWKTQSSYGTLVPYDKHVEKLRQVALSADHAASRYADVIVAFLDALEAFKAERSPLPPIDLGSSVAGQEQNITDEMWMASDFGMRSFPFDTDFGYPLGGNASMMDFSAGSLQPLLGGWLRGSDYNPQGGNHLYS